MIYKKIATSIFLVFFTYTAFAADCYQAWINSYDELTETYHSHLEYCESQILLTDACLTEAEDAYDHGLDQAGQEYYDCVND